MPTYTTFRPAKKYDAKSVTNVYLLSRKTFVKFAPLAHSDVEIEQWITEKLIPSGNVTVAVHDKRVVGMMVLAKGGKNNWLDHLYLHPDFVGRGIGSHMLERAKAELGAPIQLYTFQENRGAIRFYERHGFVPIEYGDGSGNEEKCPDVLMRWSGT